MTATTRASNATCRTPPWPLRNDYPSVSTQAPRAQPERPLWNRNKGLGAAHETPRLDHNERRSSRICTSARSLTEAAVWVCDRLTARAALLSGGSPYRRLHLRLRGGVGAPERLAALGDVG
jgi:hypothetical protein